MIVLSSFVFAVVIVMLGYCVWKYRAKPGDESDGEPIHGNTKLEIAWTVIPTMIVLFGAVYSGSCSATSRPRHADDAAGQRHRPAVQVDLRLPARRTARRSTSDELVRARSTASSTLHLTALDVLHSFWVPEWRIKRDLVPAGPGGNDVDNNVVVTPDRLGTYNVVCTELCGFGHATMRALVHVVPQDEFDDLARQAGQARSQRRAPHRARRPGRRRSTATARRRGRPLSAMDSASEAR